MPQQFPIITNKTIDGFTYDKEGVWNGPFWFIQAADTQLGMIDYSKGNTTNPGWDKEIELCKKLVSIANSAKPKPRFVVVCGDLVDARPLSLKPAQIKDFKLIFSQLDPDIKPVCVCGNHDVGDHPIPNDVLEYKKSYGDDYFSFWVGGVKFFALNSQYYFDDSNVKELSEEQDKWLDKELVPEPNKPWKHLIGFQHIPPFLKQPDEEQVDVFDKDAKGVDLSLTFNFGNKAERKKFLSKLKNAGVSKLFCGHYHRNAGGWDDKLEVIVTSAVGCPLGDDDHGFRMVKVYSDRVCHNYQPLSVPIASLDLTE